MEPPLKPTSNTSPLDLIIPSIVLETQSLISFIKEGKDEGKLKATAASILDFTARLQPLIPEYDTYILPAVTQLFEASDDQVLRSISKLLLAIKLTLQVNSPHHTTLDELLKQGKTLSLSKNAEMDDNDLPPLPKRATVSGAPSSTSTSTLPNPKLRRSLTQRMSDVAGAVRSNSVRSSVHNRASVVQEILEKERGISESTQSVSAALFGDPNMPMVEAVKGKEAERAFRDSTAKENMTQLYASISSKSIKIFLQASRVRIFDVDITKWQNEGTIIINDLREDYKSTEVTEITKNTIKPNEFLVCAHTSMGSNQQPQGVIEIESDLKLVLHSIASKNPVFSITGEFPQGRFLVIGREDSRAQTKVGNSSGWTRRKGWSFSETTCECNFEISEEVLFDKQPVGGAGGNERRRSVHPNGEIIKNSPLLMAAICTAFASKK